MARGSRAEPGLGWLPRLGSSVVAGLQSRGHPQGAGVSAGMSAAGPSGRWLFQTHPPELFFQRKPKKQQGGQGWDPEEAGSRWRPLGMTLPAGCGGECIPGRKLGVCKSQPMMTRGAS